MVGLSGLSMVMFYKGEMKIPVFYRGVELASYFMADFVCYESVIVELKAITEWSGKEKAQVLNYLKSTGYKRALLINFGKELLDYERIANFFDKKQSCQQSEDYQQIEQIKTDKEEGEINPP